MPHEGAVPPAVLDLLDRVDVASAVVFSTPEYAGGLPGAFKNLLDWTVGGGELYGKAVAWLDVANPGRGDGARAQLHSVLGYVGARVITQACVHVPVLRLEGGVRLGESAHQELATATAALAAAVEEDA